MCRFVAGQINIKPGQTDRVLTCNNVAHAFEYANREEIK